MDRNPNAARSLDADASEWKPLPWFAVGSRKLWVLSLLTSGIYVAYWFARQYRSQKRARGESTYPGVRATFCLFYANDLFKRVALAAQDVDLRPSWRAGSMAALFVFMQLAGLVLGEMSDYFGGGGRLSIASLGIAILVGLVYPIAQVQKTVNLLLEHEKRNVDWNEDFTIWNWVACIVGAGFLVLATVGLAYLPGDESMQTLDEIMNQQ